MHRRLKVLLPLLILAFGVVVAVVIVNSRPEVETEPVQQSPKLVKALVAEKKSIKINVKAQGTVTAGTETILVSQVSGQIITISPAFETGGFFDKGDVLIQVDERDYSLAVTQMKLQVAQAELRIGIEEQEVKIALQEWNKLNQGNPPPLVAREPQLNEARRSLDAAHASLRQAELNLERTKIKAPYAGRIRAKSVDLGQYVNPGMAVANIYSIDYAEVRLPVPDQELAYIDFPVDFREIQNQDTGPTVVLSAFFAGKYWEWTGFLTRMEAEIDPSSRMIHLIAKVKGPYDKSKTGKKPPLTVGMFVNAEIEGRVIDDVVKVPRSAIRDNNSVFIIDKDNRLRQRNVEIIKLESEYGYIGSGINNNEKICITPLTTVLDGMAVQIYDEVKDTIEDTDQDIQ